MPTHGTPRPVVAAAGANGDVVGDSVDIPVEGEVIRGVEGNAVVTGSDDVVVVVGGNGLTPPGASSLEPIGIPDRPTAANPPIPVGEEADAAGFDDALPPAVEHAPDAVPELPPPSKSAVGLDMPAVELAELLQAELLPLIVPGTKLLSGAGLIPGEASWVAPNGTPTGPTGPLAPIPSGDVIPIDGVGAEPICASAGPALETVAAMTRTVRNFMTTSCERPVTAARRQPSDFPRRGPTSSIGWPDTRVSATSPVDVGSL